MITGLQQLQANTAFELDVVDVDVTADLEIRYGELVPVLTHGDTQLCHYHLDVGAVTEYLKQFR